MKTQKISEDLQVVKTFSSLVTCFRLTVKNITVLLGGGNSAHYLRLGWTGLSQTGLLKEIPMVKAHTGVSRRPDETDRKYQSPALTLYSDIEITILACGSLIIRVNLI